LGTFYATIVITYMLSLISRVMSDQKKRIIAMFTSFLVAVVLIIISGLRSGMGDTYFYKHSYDLLVQNPESISWGKDFGFNLFSLMLTKISTNPQMLIFISAVVTNLINIIVFNKYRSYLELQVYLYITSGYYFITMNGIRQCLAAALIFMCTKYILNGNFKIYCILICVISTFHQSTLIMIPVYFIVRNEAWSKKIFSMIILSILIVFLYGNFQDILFKFLGNTQYAHYSTFEEGGSSLIRTIINTVPVFLAFIKRDELKEKWSQSNIFINMAILNVVFVALGMNNWIFNRFTIYFQLYNFILIPYITKNCFKGAERRLLYYSVLICYFIFFYREQVIGFNTIFKSDYLNIKYITDMFYTIGN